MQLNGGNLFFLPIEAQQCSVGKTFEIKTTDAFQHVFKSLRYQVGQNLTFTDGKGLLYLTSISCVKKNVATVVLKEKSETPKPLAWQWVNLYTGLLKRRDKMEWITQKLVEMGFLNINFVYSSNAERKTVDTDKLNKVALAAMLQSLRTYKPEVSFYSHLDTISDKKTEIFLATCQEGKKIHLKEVKSVEKYSYIIGPEGDFTNKEIGKILDKGGRLLNLGVGRLRTETAALYLGATIKYICDE